MNRVALCLLCSVEIGAWSLRQAAPAHAQETDAGDGGRGRAQDLLAKGNELFRAGDAAQALLVYREAHRTFPSPKIFFNMGRCEESLGQGPLAAQHFDDFLREAPDADPVVRGEARERVTALATRLVLVNVVRAPPGALVRVDGEAVATTPVTHSLWLVPGTHRLSVEAAGRPLWLTSIEGKAGTTLTLEMPPAVVLAPPPPIPLGPKPIDEATGRSSLRRFWWLWTGLGVVVIGGATLTYLALRCPATRCE